MRNDLADVKRFMLINPTIAYEVNDQMETVLHLAVALRSFDMVEFLVEHGDCGRVLLEARDIRKQTALDLALKSKQNGLISLLRSKL